MEIIDHIYYLRDAPLTPKEREQANKAMELLKELVKKHRPLKPAPDLTARERILFRILSESEWGGMEIDRYGEPAGEACPMCQGAKPFHMAGCELAEQLSKLCKGG